MQSKVQLEYIDDESLIFIFTEDKAKYLFNDSLAGIFAPVNEWYDGDCDNFIYFQGKEYGVNLFDCANESEKLYIAVRYPYNKEKDLEKYEVRFEEAKIIANTLQKNSIAANEQ